MSKRWIWWLALVCCSGIAGLVLAESEWDAEAVEGMSRTERLAYQQAYKAELEKVAREGGWVPGEKRAFESADRQAGPPRKAFGSITYHSGVLGACCQNSFCVGNQFDTALNTAGTGLSPVMMSGSITMATFNLISVAGGAVFFSVFDNQTGTAAGQITSISLPAASGSNTVTFAPAIPYSGSSFLAGIWQFNTDVPAVGTGTVGGQGFHGMSINDIVGTGFTTLATLNAAMSVSGNVLTPVELLNFEVE